MCETKRDENLRDMDKIQRREFKLFLTNNDESVSTTKLGLEYEVPMYYPYFNQLPDAYHKYRTKPL